MKLFVKEKSIDIIRKADLKDAGKYDIVIDGVNGKIDFSDFRDDVLIINASVAQINSTLEFLAEKNPKKVDSVTLAVDDEKSSKHFLKKKFTIIKAGGGLVVKDNKFLMIYRSKKWDLPKGKFEKNEKSVDGAKREVEEECNIKVEVGEKICATWHTYIRNKQRIMKKTNWYVMHVVDDSSMTPQTEEDIEEVRWMRPREAKVATYNSYASIRQVFREYFKMEEKATEP